MDLIWRKILVTPKQILVMGTLETKVGRWILPGGDWDDRHAPHTFKDDSRFEMTSAELSEIPLDSKARIQLDVTIPDGVTNNSILHLIHNTATYWDSDKSSSLSEKPSDSGIGNIKEGEIKNLSWGH